MTDASNKSFEARNRGKRSICVDLKNPNSKEVWSVSVNQKRACLYQAPIRRGRWQPAAGSYQAAARQLPGSCPADTRITAGQLPVK